MAVKSMSYCQGKGSLSHNNRDFVPNNVNPERTKDNITYAQQSLADAYEECFGESMRRYNKSQTRADRRIDDYYSSLFGKSGQNTVATGANKQKSFYEALVQVGDMNDSGVGTPDGEAVAKCLDEYMRGFQARNPQFHVFNAVLHLDEATPHLHIDYIPVATQTRGMDRQNGIAKALEQMGYGKGKDAINRWRVAERRALEHICREHGIEIAEPKPSRGSMSVEVYKELKEAVRREVLGDAIAERDAIALEASDLRFKALDAQTVLNDIEDKRKTAERQMKTIEGKLKTQKGIEELPVNISRPTFAFGRRKGEKDKVIMLKSDYESLVKTALASPRVQTTNELKEAKEEISRLENRVEALVKEKKTLQAENDILRKQIPKKPSGIEEHKREAMISAFRRIPDKDKLDLINFYNAKDKNPTISQSRGER